MMKRFCYVAIATITLSVLSSCETDNNHAFDPNDIKKSVVILYENDVHCGIDGYTQMRGLRDAIVRSDTSVVGMVSAGDFLQGDLAGAISQGKYVVDIMKNMGYDAVTLGNHEFDYGVPRMQELLPQINTNVVCVNLTKYGDPTPMYPGYVIKQYGKKRIAFVGICTPETMRSEAYSFFEKDGTQIYDLHTDECFTMVQEAVDKARKEGADHVVLLSHLGEATSETGVDSHTMIAKTRGIDAVLDGHTHSVIPCDWVENLDGEKIPVTQTGTKFANVGKLWLSPEGKFIPMLVSKDENPFVNDAIMATTDSIKTLLQKLAGKEIGTTAFDLIAIEGSSWPVRVKEMPLGNLVADAYRAKMDTQIGIANGGGLRSSIKAGTITLGDVIAVQPNDNNMIILEVTGTELPTMLSKCTAKCPEADGSFPQVSGLKFTIHTASHKVTDVMVQDKGADTYQPIDPNGKYTVATIDYALSGGFYRTLQNCKLMSLTDVLSRDALAEYLATNLKGVVPDKYKDVEGRITIVND